LDSRESLASESFLQQIQRAGGPTKVPETGMNNTWLLADKRDHVQESILITVTFFFSDKGSLKNAEALVISSESRLR